MNDEHFHQLLNSYLDGELPVSDRPVFRKALQESARYRVVLRQQMRLQAAQRAAVLRTPRLHTSLFGLLSSSRLCRGGAVLMNAAVLLFAVSLFQHREPFINMDATSSGAGLAPMSSAQQIGAVANGESIGAVGEMSGAVESSLDGVDVSGDAGDLNSGWLTEDYGFVRL